MKKIVTLTSDLGFQQSIYHTIAHLFEKHGIQVIHIEHFAQRNNLFYATYSFLSVLPYYEHKIWHINLVGLMDNPNTYLALSSYDDFVLLTPDNGFASLLQIPQIPTQYAISYKEERTKKADYFTCVHQIIQIITSYENEKSFAKWADNTHTLKKIKLIPAQVRDDMMICDIIFIRPNGNLVLNVTQEAFEQVRGGRTFRYEYLPGEEINHISHNPNEVQEFGKNYMIFNHAGYLEIGSLGNHFARTCLKIDILTISNFMDQEHAFQLGKHHKVTIYFENTL